MKKKSKKKAKVFHKIQEVRDYIKEQRRHGRIIGFVPTMGFLHEGHLSLMRKSIEECDITVISIFVNPTQFGPGEDYDKYPRDIEGDIKKAESIGVDCVFIPSVEEMYKEDRCTVVIVGGGLTDVMCGISRPHHFQGVTTVVTKLFNIVLPDKAYFGRKDAQQAIIIQRMVDDLNFPIEIVVLPTVREEDGLAMSSRNSYLSKRSRKKALRMFRALKKAGEEFIKGDKKVSDIIAQASEYILEEPDITLDYFSIVDPVTLKDIEEPCDNALIAAAIYIKDVRLIDNVIVRNGKLEL